MFLIEVLFHLTNNPWPMAYSCRLQLCLPDTLLAGAKIVFQETITKAIQLHAK
jgi:hypothetical protein